MSRGKRASRGACLSLLGLAVGGCGGGSASPPSAAPVATNTAEKLTLSGPVVGSLTSGLLSVAHQTTQPKTSGDFGPVLHTQCADYTASAGNNGSRYVGHEADFLGDVGGQRVSVRLYAEEQAGQTRRWPGVHQVSAFGQADGSLQVWFVGTSTSWDRQGGSFTVAPDGRSGTVDAAAGDGPSDPLPVRAKGTWACP